MAIPQTFIQDLIARVDIVEVIGRHVELKRGGANYSGRCPFHAEKSPSFTVSPTKQFFHCFGCGKHGNVIGFLMEHTGAGFVDAVKDLSQQYGMAVPDDDRSSEDKAIALAMQQKQLAVTEVLERASTAYQKHLKNAPVAIDYLKGRGLSGAIAKTFGLGYAPKAWRALASVFPDYEDGVLVESGLVIGDDATAAGQAKRYDRFRDRVMFPIRNVKGECIGFGGRVLDQSTPKYLNSPETPVFSKGRELYGLFEAKPHLREFGYALVTEGYMDVVALAQMGFPNAVATLGTACTRDHVQKLLRFTDAVVFSFDGDAAGRRAARRALEASLAFATDVRSVKFLFLPTEHDPDSYIRAFGQEAFRQCVASSKPLSLFLTEVAQEDCDLQYPEGRAKMLSQARPLWSELPDGALKRQLLIELSHLSQMPADDLDRWWQQSTTPSNRLNPSGETPQRTASPRTGRMPAPVLAPQTRRQATIGKRGQQHRIERLLLLLMEVPSLWDALNADDHEVLCVASGAEADLLRWLETQYHDDGPQTFHAICESAQRQSFAELCQHLKNRQASIQGISDSDARAELKAMLAAWQIERLKQQETQALENSNNSPSGLETYRLLFEKRRALESANSAPKV